MNGEDAIAPDATHDESWHDGFASGYKLGKLRGRDAERRRIRERAKQLQAEGKLTVAPLSQLLADLLDGVQ